MSNLLSFASTMKSLGGVVLAIVILLAMVTIHEFGHYVAGRILGFKINEFAVGFGPAIWKKRSKKTGELFALRIIPLGGYCAFDGEDEYDESDEKEQKDEKTLFAEFNDEKSENDVGRVALNEEKEDEYPEPKGERFNDQPPWKRIIVLVAGATMNYLLALTLIFVMFTCIGRPAYKVMALPSEEATATSVVTDEKSDGFAIGDVIVKIDGKYMYMITDYMDVLHGKKAGEKVPVTVLRDGKEVVVEMELLKNADFVNMSDTSTLLTAMGINSLYSETVNQSFFAGIGHSFTYSFKIGGTILRSLGELLTGKMGLESVGGPITTIQMTSQAASSGIGSFLNIASFIGVNLAVFNLLPIPALDGCKVIFCVIEWIRKKPVNRKVETIIHLAGIIFLFGFAILVDILQLFI